MKPKRKLSAFEGYMRSIPKGAIAVLARSTQEKTVVSYWFNGQHVEKEFPPEPPPDDLPDEEDFR